MKIEIIDNPKDGTYTWKLWTGPDSIDEYDGLVSSLGEWHLRRLSNTKSGMV
jgi:hypothetical protein